MVTKKIVTMARSKKDKHKAYFVAKPSKKRKIFQDSSSKSSFESNSNSSLSKNIPLYIMLQPRTKNLNVPDLAAKRDKRMNNIGKLLNCATTNNLEFDESIDETVGLTNHLHPTRPVKAYGKPIPKFKFSHKWLEGKQVFNELEEIHDSDSGIPEAKTTRKEVATPLDSNPISKGMRTKANVDL
ncbi:hypothetical protein PVK06_023823 [Gossypium arboreum]|uniref:Uncharacterized protein n=1 Tax=Gossypium arboreum TaxID=29729 RepID=A0ABR0PCI1_GOSAR|nr:hypothetical protein PVK06_023823 [Gossypium arboreum]